MGDYEKAKDKAEKASYESYKDSKLRATVGEPNEWLAHKIGFNDGYELGKAHVADHIPEVGEKVDRTAIAAMAMQGILADAMWVQTKIEQIRQELGYDIDKSAEALKREIAEDAVEYADALIAELGKESKL